MAEFIPRDIKRIKFDLFNVKVGESIFSKNEKENVVTLCVKTDDAHWRIFIYDQENRHLHSFNSDDPDYHLFRNNEIFDAEKTKWVKEYFEKVDAAVSLITGFESSLRYNFI